MGKPTNLSLFGEPLRPIRSGRFRTDAEAGEEHQRSVAYNSMIGGGFEPVCPECQRPMVVTPSSYLVCPLGHTGLKDPRDYPRVHLVHEDQHEDTD